MVADLHRLRELEGEKYPGIPYFLYGHSMGSFLTRTYLIQYPGTVSGAILSGTGQESPLTIFFGKTIARHEAKKLGRDGVSPVIDRLSLGAYNKKFAPNRTAVDWISSDEAVADAYVADPLCGIPSSIGLFLDMMDGLTYIASKGNLAYMDKTTPIYLFSGEKDPVGGMGRGVKTVYGLFQNAGCSDITLKLYPAGRHEMHNEPNHNEVFADLLAWLERHI